MMDDVTSSMRTLPSPEIFGCVALRCVEMLTLHRATYLLPPYSVLWYLAPLAGSDIAIVSTS